MRTNRSRLYDSYLKLFVGYHLACTVKFTKNMGNMKLTGEYEFFTFQ